MDKMTLITKFQKIPHRILDVGDTFYQAGWECSITKIDAFNGIPHYGFYASKGVENGFAGWVPCDFVPKKLEEMTKDEQREILKDI